MSMNIVIPLNHDGSRSGKPFQVFNSVWFEPIEHGLPEGCVTNEDLKYRVVSNHEMPNNFAYIEVTNDPLFYSVWVHAKKREDGTYIFVDNPRWEHLKGVHVASGYLNQSGLLMDKEGNFVKVKDFVSSLM